MNSSSDRVRIVRINFRTPYCACFTDFLETASDSVTFVGSTRSGKIGAWYTNGKRAIVFAFEPRDRLDRALEMILGVERSGLSWRQTELCRVELASEVLSLEI